MINKNKVISLILARGGSMGIPKKNLAILKKKPLIYWTIKSSINSSIIDETFVSTDDREIQERSIKYGASCPFLRPKKLSLDNISSNQVILYLIKKYNLNNKFDILILLQPTSPLRNSKDIDDSLNLMIKNKADSVISVVKNNHPSDWTLSVSKKNIIKKLNIKKLLKNKTRQQYPVEYSLNGAIYAIKIKNFLKEGHFYSKNSIIFEMPFQRSVDIDNIFDLKFAELLISEN